MPEDADYRVDLSNFNGPLDLLLFLIREREIDIHDIPISEITEQYLGLCRARWTGSMSISAGDFLLMASTLMLIKSRMLLPTSTRTRTTHDEELDPRTDLVRQLLEYKQFKDASSALAWRTPSRSATCATPAGWTLPDAGGSSTRASCSRTSGWTTCSSHSSA